MRGLYFALTVCFFLACVTAQEIPRPRPGPFPGLRPRPRITPQGEESKLYF